MKDNPNEFYEDDRIIGEEGWEEVDENDVLRTLSQDDVAIAITPSISEGGSLFTKIEIITCDIIRGGTHLFKKGTRYIIGKFLNQLSNIFVSEIGRMFQVWFLNKFNDLVNDMAINIFSGFMNEEAVNFNLRYIDTIYNYDDIIPMGLNLQNKSIEITSNGQTNVEPDFGYQGLGEVQIKTNVPGKRLELKGVDIRSNGLKSISPDDGFDGLSMVNLNVNVPSSVNNQDKSVVVESNGFQQVVPDQGYSGIGELNLTVDVPQPVIQDNDIRYIVPSNEARQIIVEPGQGFDALEKVTLNIASVSLVTNQNILSLTSNGIFSLPSLSNSQALGFADSCTVSVNGNIDKFEFKYLSLAYSNPVPPAALIDLENDVFTGSNTNDVNITLPEGRALCMITLSQNNNGRIFSIKFVGNPTGTGDTSYITVSKNKYYREINYDIGARVYVRSSNNTSVLSIGTHSVPDKIFLETDRIEFNNNYMYSPVIKLNVI